MAASALRPDPRAKVMWTILRPHSAAGAAHVRGRTPYPMKRSQAALYAQRKYGMSVVIQPEEGAPAPVVEALGLEFAGRMAVHLSGAQWAEMREKNAAHGPGSPFCASHDYVDANDVMAAAFRAVMERPSVMGSDVEEGRATDAEEDADLALWNAAWAYAKARYLTA